METLSGERTFKYYVTSDSNIPADERIFYIQLLRQTQDFMDTKRVEALTGSSYFDIVMLYFKRSENGDIIFDGALSNGCENRCVDGIIKQKGKRYYVLNHVYRLGLDDKVPEWLREYYVYDTFKNIQDRWYQDTFYDNPLEYRQRFGEAKTIKRRIAGIDLSTYDEFKKQYINRIDGATK